MTLEEMTCSVGGAPHCPPQTKGLMVTVSACLSCSDDEDVAPLSAKFADIYPLTNYDDTNVVANMNGIHSELNGGGENMALKDEVWVWLFYEAVWVSVNTGCGGLYTSFTLLLFWKLKQQNAAF